MYLFDKLKESPNKITEVIHLHGNYYLVEDTLYYFSKDILNNIDPTYYIKRNIFIYKNTICNKYIVYDLDKRVTIGNFYDNILLYDSYIFLKNKDKTDIYFFDTTVFYEGDHNCFLYIHDRIVYDYKTNIIFNDFGDIKHNINYEPVIKEKGVDSINVTAIKNSNLIKITLYKKETPIQYVYVTIHGEIVYRNSENLILN